MRKVSSILMLLILGLIGAGATASLISTLLLPPLLRQFACNAHGLRCTVGRAKVQPRLNLSADLVVQNLTVLESDGPEVILQARRVAVTVDLPALVRTGGATPTQLRLDRPDLRLRTLPDGRWNIVALADTVRRHVRPTARVTPLLLPRVRVTSGEVRVGASRVSALDVNLEPKASPLLFEVQAKATVGGQTLQMQGVVGESLEGEFRAEGRDVIIPGATRAWMPRATVRARLDLPGRALRVSEWMVEDQGVMARGTAAITYADEPPAYEITLTSSHIDLAALAETLPLPRPAELAGRIQLEPITVKGQWPRPPVARFVASLAGGGLHLPAHRLRLTGLRGICRLEQAGTRFRLQADLRGDAIEALGQQHASPALRARIDIDPADGDVTIEEASASIPGARINAMGQAGRWGSESFELRTTVLVVKPDMLERFFAGADGGATIKAIREPSIHLKWPGTGRPWSLTIATRSTDIAASARGPVFAKLERTSMALERAGASWETLQGTLVTQKAELAGRTISDLMARFRIDPDHVRVTELRLAAAGGTIHGHGSSSRPSPLSDLRVTLSANDLQIEQLLPAFDRQRGDPGLTLDAEISAAVSRGYASATIEFPPGASHRLTQFLHGTDETNPPDPGTAHRLILRAQGELKSGRGFEVSGSLAVEGIRALLAGKGAEGRGQPVTLPVTVRDGRVTIQARELTFTAHELAPIVSRLAGRRLLGKAGSIVVSADAALGGSRPLSVPGEVAIKGLAFDLARHDATPAPLLQGLKGSMTFALDAGALTIKETALRTDDGLTLTIGGRLPIARTQDRPSRFRVTLPWTEMSSLRTLVAALTPGAPTDARLSGQVRADLDITDRGYQGNMTIRGGGIESGVVRVDGISGIIPLSGRIGHAPTPNGASAAEGLGPRSPSEDMYEQVRTSVLERRWDAEDGDVLSIASLRYGPIEIRDFRASFAQSGDGLVARRFAFRVWGGRGGGRAVVDPLRGHVTLTLLADALSLQGICDAFPAIKGYISGRINGLAEFSSQQFALDGAQGRARFWAVRSRHERNEISRTLIEKLAGQHVKYFSLFGDDRRYDRGVLDVSLKKGDLVFHELDISHTTLGIKDLDVKVSPDFNRISAAHLLDTIIEATKRVQASGTPKP